MEHQPKIEKGKVTTEDQIKRIGRRLVERAYRLEDQIIETNQYGPAASSIVPEANKVGPINKIDTDYMDGSLKYTVSNEATGRLDTTVINPDQGALSANVSPLDGSEGTAKIAVDGQGNRLYTQENSDSMKVEHQMTDEELRHTAAEALNKIRNELNNRS